jgi:very-short-patch-repair endonuclease
MSKVLVAEIAARQWGRIHWRQLRECDVSTTTLSRWVDDGYLHRVLPRVYAVGHTAPGPEANLVAALLYAGPGAMLSHATAAWWWGLIEQLPARIHVSTPKKCAALKDLRVHGRRRLERTWHRRLPITSVAQTLLDFSTEATPRRIRRAVAEADFRRLLDFAAVEAALGNGRGGSDKLRAALGAYRPDLAHTRSDLEQRFVELVERGGVPRPQLNAMVCGLMVDALWEDEKVIVELDGRAGHGTAAQVQRDHERDLILRAAGYTVLRYTWRQITREGELVLADLRQALGIA